MSTIANLNVKLAASIGGFAAGMSKAAKSVSDLGSDVASTAGRIAGWGGAIAAVATGGGLGVLIHSCMEAIDVTAKLADRMGSGTEAITALEYAAKLAGIDAESLTGGLTKMQKAMAGVAEDGTDTAGTFARLKLSAAELANLPTDQAFAKIAEALTGIQNPAERARLEMNLFGKSGAALDPLLMRGAAGIAEATAQAAKLGITFSRVDAAKVEEANDAMIAAGAVFTGIGNTLAIQLAPFVTALANKFTDAATAGGGMGQMVASGFETVVAAVAKSTDYIHLLEAGFYAFRAAALQAIGDVLNAFAKLVDIPGISAIAPGLGLLPSAESLRASAAGLTQVAGEEAKKFNDAMAAFGSGQNAAAAKAFFDDLRAKAQANAAAIADNAAKMHGAALDTEDYAGKLKSAADAARKVTDTLADLQKQVDQAGMSDGQKKLADLATLGASPEQIAKAKALLDTLDKQKFTDKLADKAQQLVDSVKTPLEMYNEKMNELQQMLDSGLLTPGEFDKIQQKFEGELNGGGAEKAAAPSLMAAGSAAAQRFAFEQSGGVNALNADDVPKRQLKSQEKSEDWLNRIERNTRQASANSDAVLDEF